MGEVEGLINKMNSSVETCLRFVNGESIHEDQVDESSYEFFQAAKQIDNYFDNIIKQYGGQENAFQVQQEIDALQEEIENKNILINKCKAKVDEWDQKLSKLKEEQEAALDS